MVNAVESGDTLPAGLRAPRVRPDQLWRAGLVDRLCDADVQLVAVRADAGYGKTTTVRQWIEVDPRRTAWVTLDETDDDPVVLLRHVLHALGGARAVPGLDGLFRRGRPVVVASVLQSLEQTFAGPEPAFVLVLDDVHRISSPQAATLLRWLVDHIPDGSTIVLVGRMLPAVHLARRLAEGNALELQRADLAFSDEECATVLGRALPQLGDDDRSRLVGLTEGWPAGLYLSALALGAGGDIPTMLGELPLQDRRFEAYFHEELLHALPPEVQDVLVRTSVLDRLSGELCDAVLGCEGSGAIIERLAASDNLFVVALDDEPSWFRYHHLFADLLLAELRSARPAEEEVLRRRAARWLSLHRHADAAVRQAQSVGDLDLTAEIMFRYLPDLVLGGRVHTLARWVDSCPTEERRRHPLLALLAGWSALLGGDGDEVPHWLAVAAAGAVPEPLPDGTVSLEVACAALAMVQSGSGVKETAANARIVRAAGPSGSPFWSSASLLEAVATRLADRGADPVAMFRAVEFATRGDPVVHAVALAHLAMGSFACGDDVAGQDAVARAVEEVRANRLDDYPLIVIVPAVEALAAARRGDAPASVLATRRAVGLVESMQGGVPRGACHVHVLLADAALRTGDHVAAAEHLAEASRYLPGEPDAVVLWDLVDEVRERLGAVDRHREATAQVGLTEAELRVLDKLPTHLSLEEIGRELYVSRNTVKSHAIAIYRKLGVAGRSAAVDRARELGLLGG